MKNDTLDTISKEIDETVGWSNYATLFVVAFEVPIVILYVATRWLAVFLTIITGKILWTGAKMAYNLYKAKRAARIHASLT